MLKFNSNLNLGKIFEKKKKKKKKKKNVELVSSQFVEGIF